MSPELGGALFRVRLPLDAREAAPPPAETSRMKPTVLVIDDEKTFRIVAEEALSSEGFTVATASNGEAGLKAWQREPCRRGDPRSAPARHRRDRGAGGDAREMRERGLDTLIVIATAYADVASAVQALKLGAFDYLVKPLQLPELVVTVRKALEAKRLRAQVRELPGRAQAAMGTSSPGASAAMRKVIDMVDKVAEATDTTVLIQGESGTGKELIADLIAPPHAGRARTGRSSRSTARRSPRTCSRASSSATSAAPSPTPRRRSAACSRRPTAARCCSTRSARCRWPCRPSCSRCWRS